MTKKIAFTDEQKELMYKLRAENGYTYEKMGRLFGVSDKTIIRNIKSLNRECIKADLSHKFDKYYFYNIDTPDKAYWLGFITADGYVNVRRSTLQIHLGWCDRHHLEKFIKSIQGDFEVKKEIHSVTKNNIASLSIYGKEFVQGLKNHGLNNKKSNHEVFDETIPEEFYPDYIRGLWDGDGCIRKSHIDLRSSFSMCSRIQEILIDKCKISKTKIGFDSNIYRLYITKGKIDVLKYMYYPLLNKDIVLDRKYQTAKRLILDSIKVNKCRPTSKVA